MSKVHIKSFNDGEQDSLKVEGKAIRANTAFKPSSYTGKVTTDAVGVTGAIATGATKLYVQSLETTSVQEFAVLAFGTSAANAVANLNVAATVGTTGVVIPSGDSTSGGSIPPPIELGVPDNATHFAVVDGLTGQAQILMITQGT